MNEHCILVTGATSGIGRETARHLARRGVRVIVHGRDSAKVDAVLAELEGEHHQGVVADFGSFAQVRDMASRIVEDTDRLDVLVHNAGVYPTERLITEDENELAFQVNHLSPFLLTQVLLPLLTASVPSRVVTVSSGAHAKGAIALGDLMHEHDFDAYQSYADSKLANVMFSYALARRLEGTGVIALCVDPGPTDTRMLRIAHPDYVGRSVEDASAELAALCLSVEFEHSNGAYFKNAAPYRTSRASHDEEVQERLWQVSERLTGVKR